MYHIVKMGEIVKPEPPPLSRDLCAGEFGILAVMKYENGLYHRTGRSDL